MTLVVALLVSLSAPGLALAHGLAHDHLVHEHARDAAVDDHAHDVDHGAHPHDDATPAAAPHHETLSAVEVAPTVRPADHAHEHAHETIVVARGARDAARLDAVATPPVIPEAPPAPTALVVVRSPALTDRALLARPGPLHGPPPTLRAPPAR